MPVFINEETKLFHLQTKNTSYIFQILANEAAGQVYYGAKVPVKPSYSNLMTMEEHDCTNTLSEENTSFQLELVKQEYATQGKGDFREAAYVIQYLDGSRTSEFEYQGYKVEEGKKRLPGLPSSFDDEGTDATSLTVTFKDRLYDLTMNLHYTVFNDDDVIVRSASFENKGDTVMIDRALSAQLDLPDDNYDLLQFSGTWARERHLYRNHLRPGTQSVASRRINSSHHENPAIILARPNTDNNQGEAFGFNLVYSGSFLDTVEVDQFNTTRVVTGIHPDDFSWQLEAGQSFQTPEAVLSYTNAGMNALSQQMGRFYRDHLINPHFAKEDQPILINNWEATFMDFTEEKLMKIVTKAKETGIEMFVLDDGWFGHRDNDLTSLGDWFVDQKKFLNGVGGFASRVHKLGMKFGLWFEPEMISIDSKLYEDHPDWMIQTKGRLATPARHQFVLDMARQEVVDDIFNKISAVIKDTKLDYIKWDMNRTITEAFTATLPANRQQEFAHRYILGVYQLYERLTQAFPSVLFESCASGGGRFDLGMMYYAPQAWCSDDTDAVERIYIQDGTSYGYIPSMWGAHVSAVPNDQVGRVTSLDTRAKVAYFGAFGYELDLNELSEEEQETVKEQVAFYKQHRHLFQHGTFYRIDSPDTATDNVYGWQVVNDDQSEAIAVRFQILNKPNPGYIRFYFTGLDPEKTYQVNDDEETYSGAELMNAGYFVARIMPRSASPKPLADFNATMFVVKAVD